MTPATACRDAIVMLLLASPIAAGTPEPYWDYSYRGIEVTASGNASYAVNLVRNCARLDALLSRILGIKSTARPVTHLYSLPPALLKQYLGGDDRVSYHINRYDNLVLLATPEHGGDYWGAYFGYVATMLVSDRMLAGPDWYRLGVPLVFADSSFRGPRATLGTVNTSYAVTLTEGGGLIPMRTFLSAKKQDLVASGGNNLRVYDAEAWFLAHEVFVEGHHRAEFLKYLDLMRHGTNEAEAFAASFSISYEDLDKELAVLFHQRPYVYTMDSPEDPAGDSAQPLSAAETKARLALLSVRYGHGPDPVQLAGEALQLEPANETALRALALAQLARGAAVESLAAVDKLAAHGPSPAAYADSAEVLGGLAQLASGAAAPLPLDAATLRRRAQEDYEHALAENPDDRRSRDGLARLAGP